MNYSKVSDFQAMAGRGLVGRVGDDEGKCPLSRFHRSMVSHVSSRAYVCEVCLLPLVCVCRLLGLLHYY